MAKLTNLPKISVVVPTRNNREELMRDLAPSLFARAGASFVQDAGLSEEESPWLETILVDQSRTPELEAALTEAGLLPNHRISYVWTPEQCGISRARNLGVSLSRGEIVVFLDSDIRVSPDHVIAIARKFVEHPEIDALFGPVLADVATSEAHENGTIPVFVPGEACIVRPGECADHPVMGANFAIRREVALRFPFDEFLGAGGDFPSFEEVDQLLRLHREGHSYGIFMEPTVHHTGVRVGAEVKTWANDTERGRGAVHAKQLMRGELGCLRDGPEMILKLAWSNFKRVGKPQGITRLLPYYKGLVEGLTTYELDREQMVYRGRRWS
ncbi:MAG TPA: glycosyltransferase [Polyangiaceae bacterium]|nr:glycosyltransferase [Polyangiaceae bacterium]